MEGHCCSSCGLNSDCENHFFLRAKWWYQGLTTFRSLGKLVLVELAMLRPQEREHVLFSNQATSENKKVCFPGIYKTFVLISTPISA